MSPVRDDEVYNSRKYGSIMKIYRKQNISSLTNGHFVTCL